MSGTLVINVQEERGFVAVPTDLDRLAVVIGCASGRAAVHVSSFYANGSVAVTGEGYGDAVDTLCAIIEQRLGSARGQKIPAALCAVPPTTTGAYGTIDATGVTGTAVVTNDASVHPYGTYQAQLRALNNITIGTTGGLIQWSLDGGNSWSTTVSLGTASTYTIPNSNVKFVFSPASAELTELNTLINEIYGDLNAHVILTSGSVHGAADTADVVSDTTASDTATRVARVNDLRAAYELHRIKTASGVHGAADTVHVCTVAAASDDSTALALALELKRVINLHIAYTTGAVHGAADSANAVTTSAPSMGTLLANDVVKVATTAPAPTASDIDDAFDALAASSLVFRYVVLDFPMTSALLAHVSTGLDTLADRGMVVKAICRSRTPTAGESDADWLVAVAAEFSGEEDSRVHVRATYGQLTDAMTSRKYIRSDLADFAANKMRVGRGKWPCCPADRPMPNFSLVNSLGADVGHDEGPRGASTGLSNNSQGNRLGCNQRLPDESAPEEVFTTVPWVLFASDERIRTLMTRETCDALEQAARAAGKSVLGADVFTYQVDPTNPASPRLLTVASRNAIHSKIFAAISQPFKDEIENWADASIETGLLQIDPAVTEVDETVSISLRLAPSVAKRVIELNIKLSVQ